MNYGKVEERNSSRSRSPSTARRAATSAILTDILLRSDRAPTSRTAEARPGWDAGFKRLVLALLLVFETASAVGIVISVGHSRFQRWRYAVEIADSAIFDYRPRPDGDGTVVAASKRLFAAYC